MNETDTPNKPKSFIQHAKLVSGLTLLSRVTGLLRDSVLAAVLGLSFVADAFFIGFLIPNLFRRLFGEGALSSAFIPTYTELKTRDPDLARRFATMTLTTLAVLLSIVVLIGEAVLIALLNGVDLSDKTELALQYTTIMLPYMPMICVVALIGGLLQVHQRFGPPAATPLLLNAAMIAAALWVMPQADTTNATSIQAGQAIAIGVLIGGLLQLIWQTTLAYRILKKSTTPHTNNTTLSPENEKTNLRQTFRKMLYLMGPMVFGLAIFQLNALADSLITFFLSPPITPGDAAEGVQDILVTEQTLSLFGSEIEYPVQTGAVAALQWAQRLYQFPLGVFGIAVATAIFPALAKAVSEKNDGQYIDTLRQGIRLTLFIGIPAGVGLLLIALPFSRVIYERGAFELADSMRVADILIGYSLSIWAFAMIHLLTRAFYAKQDATTPVKVGIGIVALNFILNLILVWPFGAPGLAYASATTAALQTIVLLIILTRRHPELINRELIHSVFRILSLTVAMTIPTWLVLYLIHAQNDPAEASFFSILFTLIAAVATGGIVYSLAAYLTKTRELAWLLKK